MQGEKEFLINKIMQLLNTATTEELRILYAAVLAYIGK